MDDNSCSRSAQQGMMLFDSDEHPFEDAFDHGPLEHGSLEIVREMARSPEMVVRVSPERKASEWTNETSITSCSLDEANCSNADARDVRTLRGRRRQVPDGAVISHKQQICSRTPDQRGLCRERSRGSVDPDADHNCCKGRGSRRGVPLVDPTEIPSHVSRPMSHGHRQESVPPLTLMSKRYRSTRLQHPEQRHPHSIDGLANTLCHTPLNRSTIPVVTNVHQSYLQLLTDVRKSSLQGIPHVHQSSVNSYSDDSDMPRQCCSFSSAPFHASAIDEGLTSSAQSSALPSGLNPLWDPTSASSARGEQQQQLRYRASRRQTNDHATERRLSDVRRSTNEVHESLSSPKTWSEGEDSEYERHDSHHDYEFLLPDHHGLSASHPSRQPRRSSSHTVYPHIPSSHAILHPTGTGDNDGETQTQNRRPLTQTSSRSLGRLLISGYQQTQKRLERVLLQLLQVPLFCLQSIHSFSFTTLNVLRFLCLWIIPGLLILAVCLLLSFLLAVCAYGIVYYVFIPPDITSFPVYFDYHPKGVDLVGWTEQLLSRQRQDDPYPNRSDESASTSVHAASPSSSDDPSSTLQCSMPKTPKSQQRGPIDDANQIQSFFSSPHCPAPETGSASLQRETVGIGPSNVKRRKTEPQQRGTHEDFQEHHEETSSYQDPRDPSSQTSQSQEPGQGSRASRSRRSRWNTKGRMSFRDQEDLEDLGSHEEEEEKRERDSVAVAFVTFDNRTWEYSSDGVSWKEWCSHKRRIATKGKAQKEPSSHVSAKHEIEMPPPTSMLVSHFDVDVTLIIRYVPSVMPPSQPYAPQTHGSLRQQQLEHGWGGNTFILSYPYSHDVGTDHPVDDYPRRHPRRFYEDYPYYDGFHPYGAAGYPSFYAQPPRAVQPHPPAAVFLSFVVMFSLELFSQDCVRIARSTRSLLVTPRTPFKHRVQSVLNSLPSAFGLDQSTLQARVKLMDNVPSSIIDLRMGRLTMRPKVPIQSAELVFQTRLVGLRRYMRDYKWLSLLTFVVSAICMITPLLTCCCFGAYVKILRSASRKKHPKRTQR